MQFAGATPINYEWYRNRGIKTDFNIYGKVNYKLSNKLSIYADLQYRKIDYIIKGMEEAIEAKTVTYDFERLMTDATCVSCSGFGEAIINHM